MAFREGDLDRVYDLFDIVNKLQSENNNKANYKVTPYLLELQDLALDNNSNDPYKILSLLNIYRFTRDSFNSMDRIGECLKVDKIILEKDLYLLKHEELGDKIKEAMLNDFNWSLVHRNIYKEDKCDDLLTLFKLYFEEEKLIKILEDILLYRKTYLKRDPVELTDDYLNVIDEVEEILDKEETKYHGLGSCFKYWARKKAELEKRGVDWNTPEEMNPNVMFD